MDTVRHNYGINLLRFVLAFGVVGAHFSNLEVPFNIISPIAVPCFMFTSFLFLSKHIDDLHWQYVKERLLKISFPYFTIPIIYIYIYIALLQLSVK